MVMQSIAPAAPVDHAALDRIMGRLESRYGLDPRLDRAFRLFMAGRVEISEDATDTAFVTGDSGTGYWVTLAGFCECPDASVNGNRCKHQLALVIAAQMRAVEKTKAAHRRDTDDLRALYVRMCQEQQQRGHRLIQQGIRPVDDAAWREADEQIQLVKAQLPTPSLVR